MESFLSLIRYAFGLAAAAVLLSLALARLRRRRRMTGLRLLSPAAPPQSTGSRTAAQEQ